MESFAYSFRYLSKRKSRTILTLLGIIIGVATIVAMISIGNGLKISIEEQFEKFGANKLTVAPLSLFEFRAGGAPVKIEGFSEKDIEEIKKVEGVVDAVPYFYSIGTVEFKGKIFSTWIAGGTRKGADIFKTIYRLKAGRLFKDYERDAVVVGYRIYKDYNVKIGDKMKINGYVFKVVGILEEIGNIEDDSTIYMPIKRSQEIFNSDEITMIFVVVEDEKIVEDVSKRIKERLKILRKAEDFDVLTTKQLAEQILSITKTITFVLSGIASVSLLVGGIIVMNTMLMSVVERTKEIGVMKAIGATNNIVLRIFFAESVIIGIIGGVIGVSFGVVLSKIIDLAGKNYFGSSFKTVVTPELIVFGILISVVVSILASLYPAYKIAKLDPVETLRYE